MTLQEETKQTFGGRTLKQGQHVLAKMIIRFSDSEGNALPDETSIVEAYVSRIENDRPSFIALPTQDPNKIQEIAQVSMPFVKSKDDLVLWSWTWLENG